MSREDSHSPTPAAEHGGTRCLARFKANGVA